MRYQLFCLPLVVIILHVGAYPPNESDCKPLAYLAKQAAIQWFVALPSCLWIMRQVPLQVCHISQLSIKAKSANGKLGEPYLQLLVMHTIGFSGVFLLGLLVVFHNLLSLLCIEPAHDRLGIDQCCMACFTRLHTL